MAGKGGSKGRMKNKRAARAGSNKIGSAQPPKIRFSGTELPLRKMRAPRPSNKERY